MIKNKFINFIKKASSIILLVFLFSKHSFCQEISPLVILNSPYDEQHPVLSHAGEIFFSVGFHPQNIGGSTDHGDIWMSPKSKDGEWNKPIHVKSLSTSGNDVIVGFPDALTAYVYHSGVSNGLRQGIHQYSKFGQGWKHVRPLEMGNFKNQGTHFSGRLSADNSVIIMSMTSFGSYGNEDIYVSEQISGGAWSSPLNLGSDINTAVQEQTPFISSDLSIIYYSSQSNKKGSGRDIFMIKRTGKSWTNWSGPIPLEKVNSQGAELSFVIFENKKNVAFYTSTKNSEGFGDLMMITHPKDSVELIEKVLKNDVLIQKINRTDQIKVTDIYSSKKETATSINSDTTSYLMQQKFDTQSIAIAQDPKSISVLMVRDSETNDSLPFEVAYINRIGTRIVTNDHQDLQIEIEKGVLEKFVIASNGYIPKDVLVSDWQIKRNSTIYLTPVKIGASVVLNDIQFDRGTSDFADANITLIIDELVEFLKINPNVRIRLEGHTDDAGDPKLNKELSMDRASKIRVYMTSRGVDFERVRIAGMGGARPVADNNTEEGKALNRRVEMIIERSQ